MANFTSTVLWSFTMLFNSPPVYRPGLLTRGKISSNTTSICSRVHIAKIPPVLQPFYRVVLVYYAIRILSKKGVSAVDCSKACGHREIYRNILGYFLCIQGDGNVIC